MKQFSPRPLFLSMIALLGILSLTSACNKGPSEFDLRVLQHLQSHNRIDANEFDDLIRNGMKKIEEQTKNGNMKYDAYIPMYQQLKSDHDRTLTHFNRLKSPQDGAILQTFDAEDLVDSVGLALDNWQSVRQQFCKSFQILPERPMEVCQSKPIRESDNLTQRFSNSNQINWPTELQLIQAQVTDEALEMVQRLNFVSKPIICWQMDTLVLLNFTNSNAIQAGEEAQIGLRVALHDNSFKPEYAGTGRIEMNPGGETATLHIKTSEDMIPKGQNETEIPYTSKAIVPKANGEQIELHTEGKIKIRRPCKSQ